MSKRWLLVVPVAGALAAAAWFEPTYSVRGWARGEPFFQGRSASYWEAAIAAGDPDFTGRAPEKLEAGKGDAVPVLLHLLGSERTEVRWAASDILGKIGAPAAVAVPDLLRALDDPDPYVRASAAQALAAIKPDRPEVIHALIARLKTDDRGGVVRPLSAFGAKARDAVPDLIAIMKGTDPLEVRRNAARTLGKIGPDAKAAVPDLIELTKSPEDLLRGHAAESLGEIGDPRAIPHLVPLLRDPVAGIRRHAARSLGQFGPDAKAALPEIEKLLGDKNDAVNEAARVAVRRIDPGRKP